MFEDKDPTNFDMYGERWGRSEKSLSRRQALLGGRQRHCRTDCGGRGICRG